MSEIKRSLLTKKMIDRDEDEIAMALACVFALARSISELKIGERERLEISVHLDPLIDFHFGAARKIGDAILERHRLGRNPQGEIEWRGAK